MRIGYATTYDSSEISNWSGLGYFIRRCLQEAGASVEPLGPLKPPRSLAVTGRRLLHRYLGGGAYLWDRDEPVGRHYAKQLEARLSSVDIDAILSPGTIPIAYLEVTQPIIIWADATFAAMRNFYPDFVDLARASVGAGEQLERAALDRASLAIYASDWAAASAIEHYQADPAKVKVVPFGANIEEEPNPGDVAQWIEQRPTDSCRLLFIGIDWERKGGDVAVQVAQELNRSGLPTELAVVGSAPALSGEVEHFVKVEGFVDKRTAEGRSRLQSLLATSHFVILPSRAECYGLALCEANAFGVPSLATNVGGIPTIVRQGVNGMLFDDEAAPAAFADFVRSTLDDPDSYRHLAISSYEEYRRRLNWTSSGQRVMALLEQLPGTPQPSHREARLTLEGA